MANTNTAQLSLFGIMEEQRRQRAEETIPVKQILKKAL